MTLTFYPNTDDAQKGEMNERIDVLMEAAERYRAVILDTAGVVVEEKKAASPREQTVAYNWEEIAKVLRIARMLPEMNRADKAHKANLLTRLAEVYEVLRAAKMPKLEAVRLALISESSHLRGS